jgi:hypothetical protein
MKCTNCNAELYPGDRFCGECAHPVSATVTPPSPVGHDDLSALPLVGSPVQHGTYEAEISREYPGCLILLVDQSGSMEETIAGGAGQKKKEAAAEAINHLLNSIILRCCHEDGVRHYFDIGVFGYGVDGEVQSAFDTDLLSIIEIEKRPKRIETCHKIFPDGGGGTFEQDVEVPIWLDPMASGEGKASMNAAFERASAAVADWIRQHPDSFPPIIINITNGGETDKNPAQTVAGIQQQATQDGNVLVFNCHISEKEEVPIVFPNDDWVGSFQKGMKELYEISSPLPEPMRHWSQFRGYAIEPGARGCIFNASLVTLSGFLNTLPPWGAWFNTRMEIE